MLCRQLLRLRPGLASLTGCFRASGSTLSGLLSGSGRNLQKPQHPQQPSSRRFSSDVPEWRRVRDEAAEVLAHEIQEEHATMDEGAMPMPVLEAPFQIHHEVGHNEVVLTHEHEDGALVRVLFLAQTSADDAHDDFPSDSESLYLSGSESEQSGLESEEELSFTVTISYPKEKSRGVMVYKCRYGYEENEIILESVSFVPSLSAVPSLATPATPYISEQLSHYSGPKLDDLDEAVQSSLFQYLQSRMIDTQLCSWMLHYSLYKEQLEYMEWLARFKKFVE